MKTTIKVGVLITNQKGDVLLIKEKYLADSSYKWNIIKGTCDDISETPENCIIREIKDLAKKILSKVGPNIKDKILNIF